MTRSLNSRASAGQSAGPKWGRVVLLVGAIICLYLAGRQIADVAVQEFGLHLRPSTEPIMHRVLMVTISIYVLLMAIPFMPAMEIGLTMIVFFGPKICFLVYLSTVLAMSLSYLAGRLVPASIWARGFGFMGLKRAEDLVAELVPLSGRERLDYLLQAAPSRIAPFLLRHRFLVLAAVVNLPGNILVGGGGGIGLIAGMSGLFPLWQYLLTVAFAVAPVPFIVWLFG